ncbi:MAG: Bifunctional oligoribonuclease and PAP phosphatase NrnA [Microgenomates bacterium OLB22]|nr:MAG: Bifunctional oligoribonuclease and PAP phosphatase NrnA [Microgenomates bacterium OLB22]
MNLQQDLSQTAHLISEKATIVICLPKNPSIDALAAGASLYFGLTSLGKTVSLVSETSDQKDSGIIGAEKLSSVLVNNGDTLLVSFPFKDSSVDETSYYVENDRLHVVIRPSAGHEKVRFEDVKYTYTGGKPDLIITIESPRLESLGSIYTQDQETFALTPVINIDRRFNNTMYGKINLVDKQAASVSQLVLQLLYQLRVTVDAEIATNLYKGLASATNQFTSFMTSAQTFETAATLLKSGANLHGEDPFMLEESNAAPLEVPREQPQMEKQAIEQPQKDYIPEQRNDRADTGQQTRFQDPNRSRFRRQRPPARTYQVPQGHQTPVTQSSQYQSRQDDLPVPLASPASLQANTHHTELPQEVQQDAAPQDWLKPKIFKPHSH